MKRQIQTKIGDSITKFGVTYVCEEREDSSCVGCDMRHKEICRIVQCAAKYREDKKDVRYKITFQYYV